MKPAEKVETGVWTVDEDGYSLRIRAKTVREVLMEIKAIVGEFPEGGEEYFHSAYRLADAERWGDFDWPDGRIYVFTVPGDSEGDYVHVDVQDYRTGRKETVLLAKTFQGRDAAWAFARRLSDLLQEY